MTGQTAVLPMFSLQTRTSVKQVYGAPSATHGNNSLAHYSDGNKKASASTRMMNRASTGLSRPGAATTIQATHDHQQAQQLQRPQRNLQHHQQHPQAPLPDTLHYPSPDISPVVSEPPTPLFAEPPLPPPPAPQAHGCGTLTVDGAVAPHTGSASSTSSSSAAAAASATAFLQTLDRKLEGAAQAVEARHSSAEAAAAGAHKLQEAKQPSASSSRRKPTPPTRSVRAPRNVKGDFYRQDVKVAAPPAAINTTAKPASPARRPLVSSRKSERVGKLGASATTTSSETAKIKGEKSTASAAGTRRTSSTRTVPTSGRASRRSTAKAKSSAEPSVAAQKPQAVAGPSKTTASSPSFAGAVSAIASLLAASAPDSPPRVVSEPKLKPAPVSILKKPVSPTLSFATAAALQAMLMFKKPSQAESDKLQARFRAEGLGRVFGSADFGEDESDDDEDDFDFGIKPVPLESVTEVSTPALVTDCSDDEELCHSTNAGEDLQEDDEDEGDSLHVNKRLRTELETTSKGLNDDIKKRVAERYGLEESSDDGFDLSEDEEEDRMEQDEDYRESSREPQIRPATPASTTSGYHPETKRKRSTRKPAVLAAKPAKPTSKTVEPVKREIKLPTRAARSITSLSSQRAPSNESATSSASGASSEASTSTTNAPRLVRSGSSSSSSSNSSTKRRNANSSSFSSFGSREPKTRAAPTKASKPRPDFLGGGAMVKDKNGVLTLVDMSPFDACEEDASPVVWKGQPLPVPDDAPRRNECNAEELRTCEILRLLPAQYLDIKETLLATVIVRGPYKKRDAQGWFRIDVNKTNKLYDWFVGVGWIDIATEQWEKRVRAGLA
ncbi:hypothetical protein DFJ73DRAFT_812985 [Zopfochytrium polystomum]|nr:hypothetical protein DFJ73DRAFT_812985 [Zopfochytrium polystomum]